MSRTTTDLAPEDRELTRLAAAFSKAAADLVPGDAPPAVAFESPRNAAFGDFASNVALQLAKRARRPPQQLATEIVSKIFVDDPSLHDVVSEATALGGFINVRLAPAYWQRVVARILSEGDAYGRGAPTGERVSLEFGSANPTGPLVVVQGRTLSLGDSIANAMRFCGVTVETEWIINDAGSQVDTLGRSLYARYRQIADPAFPFPDDGYPGDYLIPIARELRDAHGARFDDAPESEWLRLFATFGRDRLVAGQRETAERFRVTYDRWQSEKELHESGAVARGVERLRELGHTYESDGAVWMRTTAFGDDKDRVLVRQDGRPTYYAPDVAYHYEKLQRNDRAMLILGPDHHGYVTRLGTIAAAFERPGAISVLIAQLMTTIRDGEVVSLSKRHGDVLTLDDVIDEVGVDAARFFFVMMNADSPMTFDLSLAKEQTNDNPVFYVQYGHARIASIVARAPAELVARAARGEALDRLDAPAEIALARRLSEFPAVVRAVADTYAPSRLARYAQSVAADFTQFYMASRVLTDDADLSTARLALALAAKHVLATSLSLLGVTAPEKMERLEADD
ncbi:MAG: arginine--tRNA ligase [Candidatus Eremiobacteraeota bacterium]|nr:arginine--tRNA ligase [Candidatus Eremiobacteraeota bacterium]